MLEPYKYSAKHLQKDIKLLEAYVKVNLNLRVVIKLWQQQSAVKLEQ
jgi:hypothetical protein